MNTLVWTSISAGLESCVLEWIISLRKKAKYEGPVWVLDYGVASKIRNLLIDKYNVRVIEIDMEEKELYKDSWQSLKDLGEVNLNRDLYTPYRETVPEEELARDCVVNYRYMDIINYLEDLSDDTLVAHFDVDMWFQDSLHVLFEEMKITNGCIFSNQNYPQMIHACYNRRCVTRVTPFLEKEESIKVKERFFELAHSFGGHINGGFIAGKNKYVLKKFKAFENKIISKKWPNVRGANQLFLNISFEEGKDIANRNIYNCMPFRKDKAISFKDGLWYSSENEIAVAVHILDYKQLLFSFNNFDIYWDEIEQL